MAYIAEIDLSPTGVVTPRPARRGLAAFCRLLRRQWRRRAWERQMRRELGDARLLADIGFGPDPSRARIVALALALGNAAGPKH